MNKPPRILLTVPIFSITYAVMNGVTGATTLTGDFSITYAVMNKANKEERKERDFSITYAVMNSRPR